MLSKLTIENYALIDHLEIDFPYGFSVITGETGAGKSILLGAISLILGQRGDVSVLLDKSRKCIVEGTFHTKEYHLDDFFIANLLDQEEYTTLRREINQTGKSRAFINDTPISIGLLKTLGDRLLNIHSQHSIITLNDSNFQLTVIDCYAGNLRMVEEYRENYHKYLSKSSELEGLIQKEKKLRSEYDYHNFLYKELKEAGLKEGEQEAAEEQLSILSHAEEIKTQLQKITSLLSEGDSNTLNQLSEVISSIQYISKFHTSINDISDRVKTNFIDLKDISREILLMEEKVNFDAGEIEKISKRLDLLYNLQKKHNVKTIEDLLHVSDELALKVQEVTSMDERITEITAQIKLLKDELYIQAKKISVGRKKVSKEMENKIIEILKMLGIPDARIRLELTTYETLTEDGVDVVRFLFSANKGVELDEISKIASGGEKSRLMLSIKSMISQQNLLPTIIFDEIDNGVSGNVAGKVGSILRKMGQTMQVIAITHLPQIAGQGESHFWVFKTSEKEATQTNIKKLNREERINEIAKMLSNKKVTSAAMKIAEELLIN
jgi:DNA repair protein RecN (Recombination protein N)